jgi:PQQ-like domain
MNRRSRTVVALALCLAVGSGLAADDWPQWLGPRRDGVWRETGVLDKFPAGGLKVLWKQPVSGGFAGPAVADGRVFVMDRTGAKLGKGNEPPARAVDLRVAGEIDGL